MVCPRPTLDIWFPCGRSVSLPDITTNLQRCPCFWDSSSATVALAMESNFCVDFCLDLDMQIQDAFAPWIIEPVWLCPLEDYSTECRFPSCWFSICTCWASWHNCGLKFPTKPTVGFYNVIIAKAVNHDIHSALTPIWNGSV